MFNLSSLSKNLTSQIYKYATPKSYHYGDTIVSKDFYKNRTGFIEKGTFKVNLGQENNTTLLYYLSEDQDVAISFMNIYTNTPIQIDITALQHSNLLWVPNANIVELSKSSPALKKAMINTYNKNNQYLLSTIKNLAINSLNNRLYDYLLTKAMYYKSKQLNINRAEMASDLNVSLESISRTIKNLERTKQIVRKSRTIILTELA